MSINLGLLPADKARLDAALTSDHNVRIVVRLLNMNENSIANLSDLLYDGQVTISSQADITRSASITLFDPNRVLSLDGVNPAESAMYFDKMISITYCVWKWGWAKSIDIPIFRGPITSMKRSGHLISIDAFGKEILSMGAMWAPFYLPKGASKVGSIHALLYESGERKLDIWGPDGKIPNTVSLGRESIAWDHAKKLAAGMKQHLFYDGRGVARLRVLPSSPVFTFRDGKGGSVLTRPDISYDMEAARNIVWVVGAKKISVWATLPGTHPLNHNRLGRNGSPRYLLEKIEDTTISSSSEAKALAQSRVFSRATQSMSAQTTTLPIPYLEERDLVTLKMTDQYSFSFNLNDMVIPLVASQSATVGSRRNLKVKKR